MNPYDTCPGLCWFGAEAFNFGGAGSIPVRGTLQLNIRQELACPGAALVWPHDFQSWFYAGSIPVRGTLFSGHVVSFRYFMAASFNELAHCVI